MIEEKKDQVPGMQQYEIIPESRIQDERTKYVQSPDSPDSRVLGTYVSLPEGEERQPGRK